MVEPQTVQVLEAEQSLLGAMLLAAEAIEASAELSPEALHRETHRRILAAIRTVAERGDEVDTITVGDELDRRGDLADVGGHSYLGDLVNAVPSASNAAYYARIVRESWVRRELQRAAQQVATAAGDRSQDLDAVLAQAEQALLAISHKASPPSMRPFGDVVTDRLDEIAEARANPELRPYMPTGLADFDSIIGGLPKGLVVLAARPSKGKTALAEYIATWQVLKRGKRVAFFSLEMAGDELADRTLSHGTSMSSDYIRNGRPSDVEMDRLVQFGTKAYSSLNRILIDDSGDTTTAQIRTQCRRLAAKGGLDLVVVDYLQLLGDEPARRNQNRTEIVGAMTRALKRLSKELRIPVLCLSQLSRATETRADKKPQLSDLRESGNIEQDADMVVFIHRPDDPEHAGVAELICAKHRNGPTGTVKVAFVTELAKFGNLKRY